LYVKIDIYIFTLDDIGSISYQKVVYTDKVEWQLMVNYVAGNQLRITLKDEEACQKEIERLAELLQVC
jgi:hypothetical protein